LARASSRGKSRAGIRRTLHPSSLRFSSPEYGPIFGLLAPRESGRIVRLGARQAFHHGLLVS
jgi:hypothetical protein